tara:strand:- start:603 stop:1217 length:615 start_codon:yes stop_codon:yes gene_type:complete
MNKILKYIIIIILIVPFQTLIAGNIQNGKEKSVTCVACHGQDGVSVNSIWPKLAGQHSSYLKSQLYEFQKGDKGGRNNNVMYGIALTLSDDDINDISAYYASLAKSIGTTADKDMLKGQNLYRGGNMEYKIQACIACHGPNGQGNLPAAIPVLSGQHADYIYQQLKNFQSNTRSNDMNRMMRNITHRMTEEEMRSVAQYIQGLH